MHDSHTPDTILVEASEGQRREVRRLIFQDYPVWRRHRSEAQFWEADAALTGAKLAHRRVWVLVPREDDKTLDFCCACLTYRHEALISPPVGEGCQKERSVTRSTAYSIGGVFTPANRRGQGHAGRLMTLMHPVLKTLPLAAPFTSHVSSESSSEPLQLACSVVLSDLGDYYERFGWRNKPVSTTCFSAAADALPASLLSSSGGCQVSWIQEEGLDETIAAIAGAEVDDVTSDLRASDSCKTLVSLIEPEADSWRHNILQSQLQAGFQGRPKPSKWGAMVYDDSTAASEVSAASPVAWAVWFYDFRPPMESPQDPKSTLIVLRHRATTSSSLIAVINAARQAAAEAGVDTVTIWNIDHNSSRSSSLWATSAQVQEARSAGSLGKVWSEDRGHSRPAIAWYGNSSVGQPPRLEKDLTKICSAGDKVEFLNAERAWCLMT